MTSINAWFIGSSQVMQEVRARIARVAVTRLPVLIEGPTGAGKELVARALHDASERSGPFVAINVCAIAESLFEDTMFGHVRGAFSGAIADRAGAFTEAHRGTLFLDEISGLPVTSQSKLLRAIETGAFRAVGARADRDSDFRLISATNVPLLEAIRASGFREDLAYRLCGTTIRVPALASHREDIAELARHFARIAGRGRPTIPDVSDEAIALLQRQPWPGNVRQLKHVVECAATFSDSARISRHDILRVLQEIDVSPSSDGDAFERRRLCDTLRAFDWDTERAAAHLGIHRASIYRRMQRLGINVRQRGRYDRRTSPIDRVDPLELPSDRHPSLEQA